MLVTRLCVQLSQPDNFRLFFILLQGLEEEIGHVTHENVPDEEELDFLYNQIEDLNLSDSCPEVEDNISILSTPKPKLR